MTIRSSASRLWISTRRSFSLFWHLLFERSLSSSLRLISQHCLQSFTPSSMNTRSFWRLRLTSNTTDVRLMISRIASSITTLMLLLFLRRLLSLLIRQRRKSRLLSLRRRAMIDDFCSYLFSKHFSTLSYVIHFVEEYNNLLVVIEIEYIWIKSHHSLFSVYYRNRTWN